MTTNQNFEYIPKNNYRTLLNTIHDNYSVNYKIKTLKLLMNIDQTFIKLLQFYIQYKYIIDVLILIIIAVVLYIITTLLIAFKMYSFILLFMIAYVLCLIFFSNYHLINLLS